VATQEDLRDRKRIEQDLKRRGISVRLTTEDAPKAQWYKVDGTPLPNLLPADDHHRKRFMGRGWSMIPTGAYAERDRAGAESGGGANEDEVKFARHIHRYSAPVGSPCKFEGCTARRQRRKQVQKGRSTAVTMAEAV
jgi:hypothetical protein